MPVEWIQEIETSREGTDTLDAGSTAVMKWAIYGTDDVPTMRAALWPSVPPEYQTADPTRPLEFRGLDRKQLGLRYWEWTANYADPERTAEKILDLGEVAWQFDTSGATTKLFVSRGTQRYPANAPDFKGAINCKTDREVEGCDIVIPALKLSAQVRIPNTTNVRELARELYLLTGTVCIDDFLEYEAGEMLFLGAQAQISNSQGTSLSVNFAVSFNEDGLQIGDIPNIIKEGHDFLWVRFKDSHDAGTLTRKPSAVYVERVYRRVSWDFLTFLE